MEFDHGNGNMKIEAKKEIDISQGQQVKEP